MTPSPPQFGVVGLGNNNGGGGNNLTWAGLRCSQAEAVQGPGVSLVPSLDLAEPGRRLSRHKAEVASRLVSMAAWPRPPAMQKACFVYIYIALRLTEAVLETPGYKDHGFSSCCVTQDMAKVELSSFTVGEWRLCHVSPSLEERVVRRLGAQWRCRHPHLHQGRLPVCPGVHHLLGPAR